MRANVPEGRFNLLTAEDWTDYALLDSGDGRKLERFGSVVVDRPDAQALWTPAAAISQWSADAVFTGGDEEEKGKWRFDGAPPPDRWSVAWDGLDLGARCAAFRHMGLFPEHSVHWRWAAERLQSAGRPTRVLNLFGYTGAMSLAAARAGAEVVHLDASPKSIGYGRENQAASGLDERTIRWICDDALKFLRRELRRGRTYDGVVVDPPKYGRGPKNEVWRLDQDFDELLSLIRQILSPEPLFVILTIYAVRLSYIAVGQALAQSLAELGGGLEWGEMALVEQARGLHLPTAVYARWGADL